MSAERSQQTQMNTLDDQNRCQQSNADPGATKLRDITTQHNVTLKLQHK